MSTNVDSTERFTNKTRIRNNQHNDHYTITPLQIPPPHLHHQTTSMFQPINDIDLVPVQTETSLNTTIGNLAQFITEHDDPIKWSKQEICTPCNCICFFIAFIFLLIGLMSGIYYGLNFFDGKHLKERVFKIQFVARNQDFLSNDLENSQSNEFHMFSEMLKKKINHLFRQSMISDSFIKTEIVAFEKKRNSPSEMILHLNIHVAVNKPNVEASDIYLILAEEIINNRLKVFENLIIDHNTIDVQERRWIPKERSLLTSNPWTYKSIFPGMLEGLSTEPTPPPRKCGRIDLTYCQFLSYNQTSYPNFFNHWNVTSIEEEFILYKELIDSECYSLSKEFLCNLLQPECVADEMILPCKEFCLEFYNACHRWLPKKLIKKISCFTFPTKKQNQYYNGKRIRCRDKPNCATKLRLQSQHHKLCDGIFDCSDQSDEMFCSYCSNQNVPQFHCGDQQCVQLNLTCDNIKDCHNGADEINCLRMSTTLTDRSQMDINSRLATVISNETKMFSVNMMNIVDEGYLEAIFKGKPSFVCGDHSSTNQHNYSHAYYDNQTPILGHNICNENRFQKLIQIESKPVIVNGPFTRFVPGTTLPSPYPIQCKSKHVYYMKCSGPKCGINQIPADSLTGWKNRKSWPGYWPWFAKININGHYYCDGTLISSDTILAQTTCFDNQRSLINNHNLTVILGSVRLSLDNSESIEYSVDSIKSQTIDNFDQKLIFLKLVGPVKVSNVIRPVCQKGDIITWTSSHKCVVLSLNYEFDVLQHRPVKIVNIEHCKRYLFPSSESIQPSTLSSTIPPSSVLSSNQTSLPYFSSSYISSSLPPMENYNNKLCVESQHNNETNYYDDTLIANNNNNGNGSCNNCSTFGRHLYCLSKNQWNLLAIEYRTISLMKKSFRQQQQHHHHQHQTEDWEDKNLILFQIIP